MRTPRTVSPYPPLQVRIMDGRRNSGGCALDDLEKRMGEACGLSETIPGKRIWYAFF